MRVSEEKQWFNQWWLCATFALVLSVLIGKTYNNSEGFPYFDHPVLVLFFLAPMFGLAFIPLLRHGTRIDPEGIRTKFFPVGFSRKFFPWKKIEEAFGREYSPIAAYGGWGISTTKRKKSY